MCVDRAEGSPGGTLLKTEADRHGASPPKGLESVTRPSYARGLVSLTMLPEWCAVWHVSVTPWLPKGSTGSSPSPRSVRSILACVRLQ